MKRLFIFSILLTSLILLSGCGIYNLSFFVLPDDTEFLALVRELDTPYKISQYMKDNFIYKAHLFYAPDPYTLWQIQEGDCNDFATFGIFIANYHGYETFTIQISNGGPYGHYIAVYKESFYSITDNQYYYYGFDNFKAIVEYSYYFTNKTWTKYIVHDYWNNIVEKGTK